MFFSDTRVPHEVLPANSDRVAVTVWFFDGKVRAAASAGPTFVHPVWAPMRSFAGAPGLGHRTQQRGRCRRGLARQR
jgi:hypothetical protein